MSMIDPTGIMAVVNSILLVYDTIRSAIEYMARILAIIDDFLTSVLEVAAGAIGGAAQKIEKGLAAAVPVAIGFLANILRLGKLSAKVREAIGKLQDWVEKGIESLIKGAIKIGGAILKGIGKLFGKRDLPTHQFQEEGGHPHVISFPPTGDEPTVASNKPVGVAQYLEDNADTAAQTAADTLLKAIANSVKARTIVKPDAPLAKPLTATEQADVLKHQQAIRDAEVDLAKILAPIFNLGAQGVGEGRLPPRGQDRPPRRDAVPGRQDGRRPPTALGAAQVAQDAQALVGRPVVRCDDAAREVGLVHPLPRHDDPPRTRASQGRTDPQREGERRDRPGDERHHREPQAG